MTWTGPDAKCRSENRKYDSNHVVLERAWLLPPPCFRHLRNKEKPPWQSVIPLSHNPMVRQQSSVLPAITLPVYYCYHVKKLRTVEMESAFLSQMLPFLGSFTRYMLHLLFLFLFFLLRLALPPTPFSSRCKRSYNGGQQSHHPAWQQQNASEVWYGSQMRELKTDPSATPLESLSFVARRSIESSITLIINHCVTVPPKCL